MNIEEQELQLLKQQTNIFNAKKLRAKFSEKSQIRLQHSIGHFMGYIQQYSSLIINFKRSGKNIKLTTLQLENKIILGVSLLMEVVFGVFGLGIPNLYFFVAFLYRCCHNNAMIYGYDPNNGQTHYLLNSAIVVYCAKDRITENVAYNSLLENLNKLELNSDTLNEIDNSALNGIFDVLFAIKLLQCVPIVGAIGGVLCWNEFRKMIKFEKIKFERINNLQNKL